MLGEVVTYNPRREPFHDPGNTDSAEGPCTPEASAFIMHPHNSSAPPYTLVLRGSQAQRATAQDPGKQVPWPRRDWTGAGLDRCGTGQVRDRQAQAREGERKAPAPRGHDPHPPPCSVHSVTLLL